MKKFLHRGSGCDVLAKEKGLLSTTFIVIHLILQPLSIEFVLDLRVDWKLIWNDVSVIVQELVENEGGSVLAISQGSLDHLLENLIHILTRIYFFVLS